MKRILIFAGAAALAATLSACSPGINEGIGNRITFDSNGMVVHASGHPNALVSRDGDLSIDGKAVAVTPGQRQLLQHYYQQAQATMDSGKAMGEQGVQVATHSIATQDAVATELPVFAPYASGDQMECTVTHVTGNDASGAKSSSFTFAMREGNGQGAAATDATSGHTTRPGESNASNSSQP